jgi:hypothetical protein
MLKLLYLPLLVPGGAHEQWYLAKAFDKEFACLVFDYYGFEGDADAEFRKIVQLFKPDVIHCQFQATDKIRAASLHHIKQVYPNTIITQWTGDVLAEPIPQTLEYSRACDATLVVSLSEMSFYERAQYWQMAFDPETQTGKPSTDPKGIVFCGGRYTVFQNSEQRMELIDRFRKEFDDMEVYGFGWTKPGIPNNLLPWAQQTELYQNKYLILGHNNVPNKKWWFSDRTFIALASGRPHLTQYTEGSEEVFTDMKEIVYYKTIDEAVEKAKWLLAHPREAAEIGLAGQRRVLKDHTWKKRVQQYKELVEKL